MAERYDPNDKEKTMQQMDKEMFKLATTMVM